MENNSQMLSKTTSIIIGRTIGTVVIGTQGVMIVLCNINYYKQGQS